MSENIWNEEEDVRKELERIGKIFDTFIATERKGREFYARQEANISDRLNRIENILVDIEKVVNISRIESKRIDRVTVSGLIVGIFSVIASVTAISIAVAFQLAAP